MPFWSCVALASFLSQSWSRRQYGFWASLVKAFQSLSKVPTSACSRLMKLAPNTPWPNDASAAGFKVAGTLHVACLILLTCICFRMMAPDHKSDSDAVYGTSGLSDPVWAAHRPTSAAGTLLPGQAHVRSSWGFPRQGTRLTLPYENKPHGVPLASCE